MIPKVNFIFQEMVENLDRKPNEHGIEGANFGL
jgi:hypothetical protein